MKTIDIRKSETKMYQNLRRSVVEAFGSAEITKFYGCLHVKGKNQHLSFVVYVDVSGRILRGNGETENEIIETLRSNMEECYNDRIERVKLYHLCDPAPETDGAGGVQGSVEQINVY